MAVHILSEGKLEEAKRYVECLPNYLVMKQQLIDLLANPSRENLLEATALLAVLAETALRAADALNQQNHQQARNDDIRNAALRWVVQFGNRQP